MDFKLRSDIADVQQIAVDRSIRILAKLEKLYGRGRWRKLKGIAMVELPDGSVARRGVTLVRSTRYGSQGYEDKATGGLKMAREKDRFVVCIKNEGYQASLEIRKIYRVIADPKAEARSMVRVVDESGEDYLFPENYFVPIQVPAEATVVFDSSS